MSWRLWCIMWKLFSIFICLGKIYSGWCFVFSASPCFPLPQPNSAAQVNLHYLHWSTGQLRFIPDHSALNSTLLPSPWFVLSSSQFCLQKSLNYWKPGFSEVLETYHRDFQFIQTWCAHCCSRCFFMTCWLPNNILLHFLPNGTCRSISGENVFF